MLDPGLFSINFGLWTLDFGQSSVYGQTTQNIPPTANAGADQQIALSTEASLDARNSTDTDHGPKPLVYSWRLVSKPPVSQVTDADISNFETATATFLPDVAGRYELQVEVFDGAASSKDTAVIDAVGVENVSTKVQVTSANDRTTLDRVTRQVTSTADLTLTNISTDTITVPISLVLLPTTADVRTPEASGVTEDDKPYYDVGAKAKIVDLKPRAAVTLGVKFVYASTVRFTYTTQVLGVVQPQNRSPKADAGADQTVNVGTNVQLSGAGSKDPDNDSLTYAWQLAVKPAGSTATLANANTVSPSFTADVPGTYTATLTVSDGKKGEDTDSVIITATRLNHPPTITSAPVAAATVGQAYSYDVEATDPDTGDVLTYSLPVAPTGMQINSTTGLIQWTPTAAQVGSQNVTVRVADQSGLFAEQSFTVTVRSVNHQPVITSTPVTAGTIGQTYNYDIDAADPDVGDTLTFSLPTKPDGMAIDPSTGLIQWTPTTSQAGAQNVTVRVQDQGGLFAEQSFTVTVVPLSGNPPVITSTPNISHWEQLNPTGTPPTPRAYTGATPYDVVNDRVILFGGEHSPPPHLNEVWVLTNASGAKGTPEWIKLSPIGGPPGGRLYHSVVYDPTSNRIIIHGGCPANCGTPYSDTWVLTNANGLGGTPEWQQLPSASNLAGHTAGYDPVSNRMVVFGGETGATRADLNTVKVLIDANGIGAPEWQTLSPLGTPPPPRGELASSAYDPLSNRLIVVHRNGHN